VNIQIVGNGEINDGLTSAVAPFGSPQSVPTVEVAADDVSGVGMMMKKELKKFKSVMSVASGFYVDGDEEDFLIGDLISDLDDAKVRGGVIRDAESRTGGRVNREKSYTRCV